ncbi:MAG: CPBP family intramembrane metalloprotease [Prevotella sp.]|nr:CPBP family intramembrane metalloprotease [Prevotella sp.]
MRDYIFPSRIWQCLLLLVVTLVISVPVTALFPPGFMMIAMAIAMMVPGVGIALYMNRKKEAGRSWLKGVPLPTVFMYAGIAYVFAIGQNFLFPELGSSYAMVQENLTVSYALLAVFIGPVAEEFIFRGVFLNGLLSRYHPWIAIAFTGMLFGILHFDVAAQGSYDIQMVRAIAISLNGLLFGYVFYRTSSVWASVAMHMTTNFYCLFPIGEFLT